MRSKKFLAVHLQKPMTFICNNNLLYSGYLIFCFWKVALSLFGTYRSIFDEVLVPKAVLGFTDNFQFGHFLALGGVQKFFGGFPHLD